MNIRLFVAAPDFGETIKILADEYMQSKLTALSAKELYFKAILLFLVNDDAIGADQAKSNFFSKKLRVFKGIPLVSQA